MIRKPHNFAGGFTLVEVLATMMFLAIVLPVAMRGTQLALQAASRASHMSEAASLADLKLNELVSMIQTGQIVSSGSSGDFAPDHPDYTWTCSSMTDSLGLTELAVQVKWNERGQERAFTLTTFVNPPTLQ